MDDLDKFIAFIDSHNASSPIGTLTFTDNLAKFGTDNICHTPYNDTNGNYIFAVKNVVPPIMENVSPTAQPNTQVNGASDANTKRVITITGNDSGAQSATQARQPATAINAVSLPRSDDNQLRRSSSSNANRSSSVALGTQGSQRRP
jgi:hypothetical protein